MAKTTATLLLMFTTRPLICLSFTQPTLRTLKSQSAGYDRIYSTASYVSDGRSLQDLVAAAERAAREAGTIIRATAGNIAISNTKANAKDLVTASDVQCQKIIEEIIMGAYPNDLFLGEEQVESGSDASIMALRTALSQQSSSLLWIVDPIDGTTNFQAGLPICCVSIGVVGRHVETGEPEILAGVIYNPILEEMVTATRGGGAFVNRKIMVSSNAKDDPVRLSSSLINVGFPVVKESTLLASSKAVTALSTKCRGLRMLACASQLMSWVAQDKFQSYISWDLNAWDVAAGVLIVQEAGGSILDFETGRPATISSRDLVVTSPSGGVGLGQEILTILQEKDCVKY
jgi:myo-inositol-1(or 4)-monophosphatase